MYNYDLDKQLYFEDDPSKDIAWGKKTHERESEEMWEGHRFFCLSFDLLMQDSFISAH